MKSSRTMGTIIRKICRNHNSDPLGNNGKVLEVLNPPYQPLWITAYGKERVCVAHIRHDEYGDVEYDPEIEFWVVPPERTIDNKESWIPVAIQQQDIGIVVGGQLRRAGGYDHAIWFGPDGSPTHINVKKQASIRSFCSMWARNLKAQGFGNIKPCP